MWSLLWIIGVCIQYRTEVLGETLTSFGFAATAMFLGSSMGLLWSISIAP